MKKIFTKGLFLLATFTVFVCGHALAQTITIGNVDPGPYAPGSTITAPIKVTGTCVTPTTVYNLYLSNAAGSFAAQKLIGTYSDFYATFVNGVIPAGTPAGNGYELKVVSTNPAVTSTISAAFSINASGGVTAAVSSQLINPTYPEVFGTCSGTNGTSYNFVDQSTIGSTVTATFFNELTQASEGTLTPTAPGVNFVAKAAQYTITVKAVNNGVVGTKSYFLINNAVNTSFGVTGSNTICLTGGGTLSYNVDISSPSGIQNNFPGITYNILWGDGNSSQLTLCDILASGGKISHNYTRSSCGNNPNGQRNSFEVDLQPANKYCGRVGTQVTSYAQVVTAPSNSFVGPQAACTGSPVTFSNTSDPGQNPNSASGNCAATNALYTWIVDGVTAGSNYSLGQNFTTTFNTNGVHNITLHLQNGNTLCTSSDITNQICIQNPPQPKFSLPTLLACAPATIQPTDQSAIDANCNPKNVYNWTVIGPAAVGYANGTNANSQQPQFIFTTAGVYQITLGITTASCGTITTAPQTMVIDAPLTVSLSPDTRLCGTNQTHYFGPTAVATQTTITGVGQAQANSYTWTVTGGPYSFANGTTANSQYPQITFTGYATYTITVTVQNHCGTLTKTQKITFQNAPTVVITPSANAICPNTSVTLTAVITGGYTSVNWVDASGSSANFSTPTSLTTTYMPTQAEITAGVATVTINVATSLTGQCASVQQTATVNIFPINNITSALAQQVCTNNPVNYQITSSVTGSTYSWTAALTSGAASGFSSGNGASINDILINNGTADAVVSYTITPQADGCTGNPSVLMVTIKPLSKGAAVPLNNIICSSTPANVVLTANVPGTMFTWTSTVTVGITGNTQQTTPVSAASINDVLVNNNSNASGTVTYTVTPYNGSCPGAPVTAVVTIHPLPITSNAGADDEQCNITTYTLNGNSPSPDKGMWTVSPAGSVTFNDPTLPNATASGLIPGNSYIFTWTITPALPCTPNSSSVVIRDDAPTIGGTTSGNLTVCSGSNGGNITLSGQVGKILQWESNTGAGWTPILNTTPSLAFSNLTQTTQYHALVQNGLCSTQYSTVSVITVNPPSLQAIAGGDQSLCGASTVTLQGNDPSPFSGVWTQSTGPAVNILTPNSAQTQVTGLIPGNDYTFVWTIKGLPPCTDNSSSMQVHNANDVTASFTADKIDGCGDYTINFTNTSTVIPGTSFLWDFGDGSPQSTSVNPSHLFSARTDGKDAVYTVSLYIVNNCTQRAPFTLDVTVRSQTPVAYISPRQLIGCSPFTLAVDNFSPGNNVSYTYYLYDAAGTLVQSITSPNKNQIRFNPITVNATQQYSLYMVATDVCGNTGQSNTIPITISVNTLIAQMFVQNGATTGCAPFNVTFINNSFGADSYYYTIYDVNQTVIDRRQGGTAPLPYTFGTPGTYYVTITATNSCSIAVSNPPIQINVYIPPQPQFVADVTSGCKSLTVNFTNQTPSDPNTQAQALLYDWDFGDGSPHSLAFTPPPHTYRFKNSPFTVTMTATNSATGCSNTVTKTAYINVIAPPSTQFSQRPDSVISVPNYDFSFVDETDNGPTTWYWSFGDGQSSLSQNPRHTYLDTGLYRVTLTTSNVNGCDSTVVHNVRVTGIPGELFLPNAFEPDGASIELKTFMAKGSGIKEWKMQIFNNYSQLIWETNRLDAKGAPIDGWDGTFKGSPMPQGVYVWQISATFINGTEWKGNVLKNSLPKRVGTIHLIR